MPPVAFVRYQQFPSADAATHLLGLLEEHDIPFETSRVAPNVDPNLSFNTVHYVYEVRLQPADVDRVNALQDEENRQLIEQADPSYYLFSFTDQELMDVLTHHADWSRYDVLLAELLLRRRGHEPDVQALQQLQQHQQRVQPLPQPEKSRPGWIIAGYVSAVLGGAFGILVGWHLYSATSTQPDGRELHTFSAQDRVHGIWIMALGGLALVGWLGLRLLR
ncbi:hypothetical protein [Hymenobacter sp. CRA2]|uniref:hypothetical protein n=1 Tax=Hymenobacter sp. CRA2 TaxID=1955620 RepID=UPI00098F3A52|nr:hypothetical protein [Hymenobacter sp. CRA2]OON68794.1 hypothetical protein B0919_11450 [Hymenobacter sp. CRA2]